MNVGFVVTHISHGSPGSFVRVHEIAKHLSALGVKATIMTPFAEDLTNISDIEMEHIPSTASEIGLSTFGYKIARKMASSRLTSGVFLSERSISRISNSISVGLLKILASKKFDILHAIQPIAGLACIPVVRKLDIPLITDLHNIWPEELAVQRIINRSGKTYHFLKGLEQKVINSSRMITVVSEFMKSYILQNYYTVENSIIVVPPSGPLVENSNQLIRDRNVVYAGMVNEREHVDLFAHSIPYVKQSASFFVSKYGDQIDKIRKITKRPDYPPVNYVWFKRRHEVLEFLCKSKIGIVTSNDDITRQIGPPLKLFDYMACGLPIIANNIGGWSEIIERERIGISTRDDPRDFAKAIDMLLGDESLWNTMHANSLNLIKSKFNWAQIVKETLMPAYQDALVRN